MIQKIPTTIKTSLVNIIMSINELNAKKGEKPYILVVDNYKGMTIMGCECMSDIVFYSDYFHKFNKLINPEDLTIMRALIVDPADLPYKLSPASNAFVLNDDVGIEKFDFMCETTEYIEAVMSVQPHLEIEDFAVLIGIALSGLIKASIIKKIEEKRLGRLRNLVVAKEKNNDV